MDNSGFLYDGKIATGIKQLSFSTNILEKYDNVVYHCALFSYHINVQNEIDEKLSSERIYDPKYDSRTYIVKDGETTKFTIPGFIMKNTFGNINSPMNIATYSIKFKIVETFSCMLTNELELLSYVSGYNSYIQRPYWFEVWFSGYDSSTGEPIARIPLPNGETSLIYEGYLGNVKSHLESSGCTWEVEFIPIQDSLLNKHTNILSVPVSLKDDVKKDLGVFLNSCADRMFERMITQYGKTDEEKNEIRNEYNGTKFITIKVVDENGNDLTNTITSNQDSSSMSAKKDSVQGQAEKSEFFTTICQEYLFNTEKYKNHIAKYDISSKLIKYYKNKALYSHNIKICLIENKYIASKIKEATGSQGDYNVYEEFMKAIENKSLIKKYQYGYSSMDTSVLEVYNNYDNLYFMNGLPQVSSEYFHSNTNFRTTKEQAIKLSEKNIENYNGEILKGNLEDIYSNMIKGMNQSQLFEMAYLNNIPEINNDLTNDVKRFSTNSDQKVDKETVMAKLLWERLYKSGQMSSTKISILGDPYWIATNAYRTKQGTSTQLIDALPNELWNVPNYRFVFIIRSTPDQNNQYTSSNPSSSTLGNSTDYSFDYAMHASGIYNAIECESIFEEGKFTQKLFGTLDVSLIKENGSSSNVNTNSNTK